MTKVPGLVVHTRAETQSLYSKPRTYRTPPLHERVVMSDPKTQATPPISPHSLQIEIICFGDVSKLAYTNMPISQLLGYSSSLYDFQKIRKRQNSGFFRTSENFSPSPSHNLNDYLKDLWSGNAMFLILFSQ